MNLILLVLTFLINVNQVTASDEVLSCNQHRLMMNREFLPAENKELQQVSYRQKVTRSHVHCVSYCHADPQCYSANYNIDNHLCQLNNATRAQYPHNFITHYGSVYFDADVNTPLLSLPDQAPSPQPDTPIPSTQPDQAPSTQPDTHMPSTQPDQAPSTQPDTPIPSLPDQAHSTQPDTTLSSVHHNSSCKKLLEAGHDVSGIYTIFPAGFNKSLRVYCDMDTDGGGWIVFQRRQDGSDDFYRDWNDYQAGFGNLSGEFWLGNDNLRTLTEFEGTWQLKIDLEDWQSNKESAEYGSFRITGDDFTLQFDSYSANSTTKHDALTYHKGYMFSTWDKDNDYFWLKNCAEERKGAWWYNDCYRSNLNGLYYQGGSLEWGSMIWGSYTDHYSVKKCTMKIREYM